MMKMMQQVNHEHYRSTKGERQSDVCPCGGQGEGPRLTSDVQVDPGVQVLQTPVGVTTAICPGVPGL